MAGQQVITWNDCMSGKTEEWPPWARGCQ